MSFNIPTEHGHLESVMREPAGPPIAAAVVCHPHPQHGGTLHTKAVFRAAQALSETGIRALRFNFRGVGTSTGEYGDGVGEEDDLRTALEWLAADSPQLPLIAGGFSFGSIVSLKATLHDDRIVAAFGLGIPVSMYDFAFLAEAKKPVLIVQGEEDEFGSGPAVAAALADMGSHIHLVRIPGTDHYFNGRFDELRAAIRSFFGEGVGAAAIAPSQRSP